MISQSANQVQMAVMSLQQRLRNAINQKYENLQKDIEQELDDLYWDYHENSEILSFDEDEQDKVQKRTLPFYQRLDESFISKHSVENLNFQEINYPTVIKLSSSCRLRARIVKPQLRKIKTQEDQQDLKASQKGVAQ